ncbi:TPA: hypothetical protein ACTARC_000558 [Salmonella enterica subsp. enterica serovar Virchow]
MTPQQIAAITAAKLEHEGRQLTPAEVREMERIIEADTAPAQTVRGDDESACLPVEEASAAQVDTGLFRM